MMTAKTMPGGPRFAPYASGKFQMAMGMVALDLKDWIDVDHSRATELTEKERLLSEKHEAVFADLPGSEDAQREVLMLLLDNLERCHPGLIAFDEGVVHVAETGKSYRLSDFGDHALDLAGRLVQEDLCLMTPGEAGYALHAALFSRAMAAWREAGQTDDGDSRAGLRLCGETRKTGGPVLHPSEGGQAGIASQLVDP